MPLADLGDITLSYSEFGEGPPCIGTMGFSLDKSFWSPQVPAVTSAGRRFITFDNRGIGKSTGAIATTIDEMANDAVRLLDHLDVEKAVIFGVSMGGTIAQRLTLDHPDRVEALILGVTWARPIEYMRRQHDLARKVLDVMPNEFLEASLLKMFSPRFFEMGRETVDQIIRSFARYGGPTERAVTVLHAQLDAMDKFDVIDQLPSIAVPTLVLGGKTDMMVPGFGAEEIAAAIPGARLKMFDSGHGCMVEEMPAFNHEVMEFLKAL
ncbi:MAG: aminoacrylate hydrolase [Actinomycetota bacterium]|jgi:pimeloyl-ACP methyl ester carboxylesterase|nr:aminoacrylate hydrolase [Actinomycetota bacterium]